MLALQLGTIFKPRLIMPTDGSSPSGCMDAHITTSWCGPISAVNSLDVAMTAVQSGVSCKSGLQFVVTAKNKNKQTNKKTRTQRLY